MVKRIKYVVYNESSDFSVANVVADGFIITETGDIVFYIDGNSIEAVSNGNWRHVVITGILEFPDEEGVKKDE